ncbi:MAG: Txe/YoeB family addiction module toxin [Bacteroidales bacterium]|nr:Txe/YoeB family addiction module toxin [Bacteroidales bacterium]
MTYEVKIGHSVEKTIAKWKKSNPKLHKKFLEILYELMEHPREGIGHPKPLVGGSDIRWSRRISDHDRIVYDIYDSIVVVEIIQVEGHYNDK